MIDIWDIDRNVPGGIDTHIASIKLTNYSALLVASYGIGNKPLPEPMMTYHQYTYNSVVKNTYSPCYKDAHVQISIGNTESLLRYKGVC